MARTVPIVLVHGYSDKSESFQVWWAALTAKGYDASTIHLANYVSLTNEITIKDIAEAFDRALRIRAGLNEEEPFDAIVHSTGMLVVREWLTSYSGEPRHSRDRQFGNRACRSITVITRSRPRLRRRPTQGSGTR
jgi:alpha-beta hydrolase superfamily lysophospholipase